MSRAATRATSLLSDHACEEDTVPMVGPIAEQGQNSDPESQNMSTGKRAQATLDVSDTDDIFPLTGPGALRRLRKGPAAAALLLAAALLATAATLHNTAEGWLPRGQHVKADAVRHAETLQEVEAITDRALPPAVAAVPPTEPAPPPVEPAAPVAEPAAPTEPAPPAGAAEPAPQAEPAPPSEPVEAAPPAEPNAPHAEPMPADPALSAATEGDQGPQAADDEPQANDAKSAKKDAKSTKGDATAAKTDDTPGECAKTGEDCMKSKCCAEPGMQCYAEQQYWGSCAYMCDKKAMKNSSDPWACKEIGKRTPKPADAECSAAGENCFETMCCKDQGFQCYSHNQFFAGCSGICDVEQIPEDPEGGEPCVEIGQRTNVTHTGPRKCAWSGEDCSGLRCCNDANMKCFQKDGYFAGCKFEADEKWVGNVLGEYRGWSQVAESVAPEDAYGQSLFCFVVISPPREATDNTPEIDDQSLVDVMERDGWGIFQCDDHSIFYGTPAEQAEWISVANTDIFIEIWNQVKDEGKFWDHDWTVKVDCDAVFFPDRLRMHLGQLNPPADKPIYMKNCDFKFGFMGSLEIFSQKALEVYLNDGDQCTDKIGHTGGEDFYMMTCMDALGVYSMQDVDLLNDKYTSTEDLILDDVSHCVNDWSVAFHPYKDAKTLAKCYQAAVGGGDAPAEGAPAEGAPTEDGEGGDGGEGGEDGGDGEWDPDTP